MIKQDYLNKVTDFFIKFFKDNYNLTLNKTDIKIGITYNKEPRLKVAINTDSILNIDILKNIFINNELTLDFDEKLYKALTNNNIYLYNSYGIEYNNMYFDFNYKNIINSFFVDNKYNSIDTKDKKYKYIGKYFINNNTKYDDIDLNNVVTLEDIISVFKDLNNLPKVSIFNKYTKANNLIEFIKNLISIKDNVILFEFINFGIILKYNNKNKNYNVYIYSNNKNGIELKLIHEQETKDLILTIINQRMNIINSDLSIMDNIVIRKGKYNNLKFIKTLNNNISYTLLSLYNNVKIDKYFDYSLILKNMNIDIFNNMAVDYFKNEINNFIDNK